MISHAWRYGEDYYRLVELLNAAPSFRWRNFSVPEDDPIHGESERSIADALRDQVRRCHVVLMLGGVFAAHSNWILREVEMAEEFGKPIVGLQPWGNERISVAVREAAKEIVGWSADAITAAVRRHAI